MTPQLATDTFAKLEAEVIQTDPVARRLPLAGTVEQLSGIFGTSLDGVTGSSPHGSDVIQATAQRQHV